MRENRLAKLAEMKKVALRDSMRESASTVATPSLEPKTETAYETAYKTEFKNDDSIKIYEKINVDIKELGTKKKSLKGGGEVFFIEAAGYYLGRLGETEKSILDGLKAALGPGIWYGQKIPTNTLQELLDYEEVGLYNKFITALNLGYTEGPGESVTESEASSKNKDTSAGRSRSVSPEATRGPSDATAVIKSDLWGKTASDSDYKYIISRDGKAFQWAGAGKSGDHKQGDKNWSVMVGRINQLTGVDRVIPTSATPAPAPAAAATTETAATTLDQSLVQKVAAVLEKALTFELNRQSVQSEQDEIRSLKNTLGGLNGLAAIIVSKVGDMLTTLSTASLAEINAGTRKELAVNMKGKFAGDVGTILRQVSEITRMGNKSPGSINRLESSLTQTPAATATAPTPRESAKTPSASGAADDGQNKSASLNKKFIKAATLRRLKIRSQMEAAIDSSAQMGRARVS